MLFRRAWFISATMAKLVEFSTLPSMPSVLLLTRELRGKSLPRGMLENDIPVLIWMFLTFPTSILFSVLFIEEIRGMLLNAFRNMFVFIVIAVEVHL